MNKDRIRELIYRQFDTRLSDSEQKELTAGLETFDDLQKEYEDIGKIREGIKESAQTSFSPYFKQKVMQRISELDNENQPVLFDSLFPAFRKLALTAVAVIVILASINAGVNGELSVNSIFNIPKTTIGTVMDSAFTFLWSN